MKDTLEIKHRLLKEGMGKSTGELGSQVQLPSLAILDEHTLLTCQTSTWRFPKILVASSSI